MDTDEALRSEQTGRDPIWIALSTLRTELLCCDEYLGQFYALRENDPKVAEQMLDALAGSIQTALGAYSGLVELPLATNAINRSASFQHDLLLPRKREEKSMYLRCTCGYVLTSIASPGRIVHTLISERGMERLQDAVNQEIVSTGTVDWPDPWDSTGCKEIWLCPACSRLFVGADGPISSIRVYRLESVGIDPQDTGIDSHLAPLDELRAIGMREAGQSPLCPIPSS
jgi:hypothetical protein